MRVLSIGNFGRSWDGSICDEEHIAKALEGLGHEVVRLQREDRTTGYPLGEYDFILIAQWNGYDPGAVPALRALNRCPIIYWAFDYQFDKNGVPEPEEWHLRLASEADIFLSKEREHAATYRHLGANFHWLPQDFAPDFLDAPKGVLPAPRSYDHEVLFTGSWLPWAPERAEYLRAVDKAYDLSIFSFTPDDWKREGFKNVYGPVMDEGLPKLIDSAKINLSIDWKHSEGYWSDRNAQIMACGGMVLFKYVPGSEMVFRDRIAYFHDIDSMLERISWYLEHPLERIRLGSRAYSYARSNLMVAHRVQDMLTIVENYK